MSLDELGIPDSFKTDIDRSCDILRSFGAREVYLFGSLSNRVLKRLWSLFNTTLICAIAQKTEGFRAIAKQAMLKCWSIWRTEARSADVSSIKRSL